MFKRPRRPAVEQLLVRRPPGRRLQPALPAHGRARRHPPARLAGGGRGGGGDGALLGCPSAPGRWPAAGWALWFAVGILGPLVVGQLPFGIGVTLSVAGLLAVRPAPPLARRLGRARRQPDQPAGRRLPADGRAGLGHRGRRTTRSAAGLGRDRRRRGIAARGWRLLPLPASALLVVLLFSGGGLVLVRARLSAVRGGCCSTACPPSDLRRPEPGGRQHHPARGAGRRAPRRGGAGRPAPLVDARRRRRSPALLAGLAGGHRPRPVRSATRPAPRRTTRG